MVKQRNDSLRKYIDETIPSDNTRVESPYRIRQRVESQQKRPKIDVRETVFKLRKQREEQEEKERLQAEVEQRRKDVERAEEDRLREIKKRHLKELDEKQASYEAEKKRLKELSDKESKESEDLYEPEYKAWLEDVQKNPNNYSDTTQEVVKRAMHSYKHPHDYLARLDRGIARALFGLKNAAGKTALSSIDTNGTTISGKMALNEFKTEALKYHNYSVQLQQTINDLEDQKDQLARQYGITPEYAALNPSDPALQQFRKEYLELDNQIKGVLAQLNDPQFKQFDDAYKQLYTIDKEGFWATAGRKFRNAINAQTYDQYKDYVLQREKLRDINNYNKILTDQEYKDNIGNTPYLAKPMGVIGTENNPRRDFNSYTQRELLALDEKYTQLRQRELEEENKSYQKEYIENRKHFLDSTKYWDVSKYYEKGVTAHQFDDLWNLDYIWYELPLMIGSTYSSPQLGISSVLTGGSLAAYGSSPWTGPIGAVAGAGLDLLSTPFQIGGGYDENRAEAGDKRIEQFKALLKKNDSDSEQYEHIIEELKSRSKEYWKHAGIDEETINKYLDGEQGENNAIKDMFMGITDRLVDENGNAYVKSLDGNSMYTNPIANPEFFRARLYSTQGLQALYDANNMRTMAGTFFEKALTLTPMSWIKKASSAWFNKATDRWIVDTAEDVITDGAGRVTARAAGRTAGKKAVNDATRETYSNGFRKSTFSDTFMKGANRGAAIGEMTGFGFVGQAIGFTTGGAVNTAMRIGLSKLSPAARASYRGVEEAVIHKYQNIYDKLLPTSEFGRAVAIFGGKAARASVASLLSEAAEEAVQYLNSKEDFASKYGWGGMSIGDMIVNDIYQGARVFDSYMSLFGLSNSELLNDAEYWANAKGGFALGGVHTGVMRAMIEGAKAYKEYGIHSSILTSNIMNREMEQKDRAAYVELARLAMAKRSAETQSVLEWMLKNDSRRENPYFSQEDYDERIHAANVINAMANSERIRESLAAKGIAYGTEMYANAIADLYSINKQREQNTAESREKENNINQLWNSPEYQKEADDIVKSILASNFDEHIGRHSAIIEQGNKAVTEEIAKAKEAGEDVETSDFKKHLLNIRKEAEERAAKDIDLTYRQNMLLISHIAHKLQSLIKLRAQHNTIQDFFTFLNDKFNIRPKRPDAKLIVKNVDEQIKLAKKALAEIDEDFDIEMSDGAILDYIKTLPIVGAHSEDIERHEIAAAMLEADRAVIDKHSQMFDFGLVRNKDGKVEYNPAAYKAKQQRQQLLLKDLTSGTITLDQYTQMSKEEQELPEYSESDVENNDYKKRIQAIIDTKKDNQALNWMINDIENGDGVTKILEEIAEKEYKEEVSDDKKAKAKEESEKFSFETKEDEPVIETPKPEEPRKRTAKEKYEARKARAKEGYKKRKDGLRHLRRNAYATFIPIPTPLLNIANTLLLKAEIATYKIAQFAEEVNTLAKQNGYNAHSFLSGIKALYIDKLVSVLSTRPELAENFSPSDEIVSFDFTDPIIPQPVVYSSAAEVQDKINKDSEKINVVLSTHYDTIVNEGDTVVVYTNKEANDNARFGLMHYEWKNTVDKLNKSNTDDETFTKVLESLFTNIPNVPIEEYVKYRTVPGIIEAIANRKCNHEQQQSVRFGKLMRKIVLSIIFNREDDLDRSTIKGDYYAFRDQVLKFKEALTSKQNGMGLTIIDTNKTIYGKNINDDNVSSEADIIATDGNKLYVIDIRYSFDSIRLNWNVKYPKATYTISEHVTRRVKQIEQIINSTFNRGVNGLYCLPIVYNPQDNILYVEESNGDYLIPIKPDTQDPQDNSIDSQKQAVEDFVNEINDNIDEYNILVDEAKLYVSGYNRIDNISVKQFESTQEYADYLNTLHANYDNLIDKIDNLKNIINQLHNLYAEVWNSDLSLHISVQDLPEVEQMYLRLRDICSGLDIVLDEIPSLKITTEVERNNVEKLIEDIFDAQYLLDQLLSRSDAVQLNLRAEEELISTALEKMVLNKDNFGKASMFVRKWWATKFSVGSSENTSENVRTISDIYFGYINKIESWVDTLKNHVLNDIADYQDLQEWYSAILNNYFTELLNNAETFTNDNITDVAQRVMIQLAIQKGKLLVQDFNNVWDTRPEEGFEGPTISPEVDKINRLPVKWMDKWGWSTSIMPSFDLMRNPIYYWLSISPTFLDSKFVLSQNKEGKLLLYIEGISHDGSVRNITLTFENNLNLAEEKDLERWKYVNEARQKFIRKAIAALDFVKTHPGYEVRFDKFTNKGEIRYGTKDGKLHSVTDFIFAGNANKHDLYTIKLSKEDRIGMLVTLRGGEMGPDIYSIKGGDNLIDDIGGFDRDYVKQQIHTQSGALVYFYDTSDGQYIGTPIESALIGDDAQKLVYLMQRYMAGDRVDKYGFGIMDLLSLRLYMASPERRLSFRNNTTNMVELRNGIVVVGNDEYNIVSQRDELIQRIAKLPNVTRANMMNEALRSSLNNVISRVRTLFGNGTQTKMLLTNGLVFDIDDFTHKNSDPNAQDGSTWLGYMMRNGLLGSFATLLGYKELRISNVRVLPKGFSEEKPLNKEIEQARQLTRKVVVKSDDFFDRLAKLHKTLKESKLDINRGVEELEGFIKDVQDYFDSVLGKNGQVQFGDTDLKFLEAIGKNTRIAGICTDEIIKLSRYVPMSVAWHEAFHKIFELVIPANERDSFYDAYKNSIYGRITNPSDRDVAEAFADMFMTYMLNKDALNKADSFYKKAISWIKTFLFNIGMTLRIGKQKAREMYTLYGNINAGKYKDRSISQEQHDRFKQLFGEGLYYTVTNFDSKTSAEFSHISDIGARDRLVRALSYYILKSYEIDGLNPKVERVKITGGTKDMKPTLDRLEEMYDGAIVEYLKSIHPVFEEVFEKVEKEYKTEDGKTIKRNYYPKFEALSWYISNYISTLFDTMRKPKIEEDDASDTDTQDLTGENIDFKSADTDHWDKAAYEFSKLDGLMDEVKLFFGTIPYSKYEDTEDGNGNVVRNVVIDYTRNEFGAPEFMPIEEVWNLIVRKFNNVGTIEELDKLLEEWSTVKEVYAQVYQKFHTLVYGENDKNDGIYKRNERGEIIIALTNFDREAKALQILSAILSLNLTFLVALSTKLKEDEDEGKSVRITESSMDRDVRSYPDLWTRYLVSGQIGVFQRERGEGVLLDAKGNKKKTVLLFREGMGGKNGTDIFSRTAKFFSDLRYAFLSNNSKFNIEGVDYDTDLFDDVNRIKDEIVHKLCTIGIMFERDAFDYMLSELYGGVDAEAVRRFLSDSPASTDPNVIENSKKSTITSFINKLNNFVSDTGSINQPLIEDKGYGDIGFVNKLASYQGQYKRMSTLSMALALNGKKLFNISQNNSISHIIKQLNTFDLLNETVKVLSGFGYNVTRDEAGMPIGSIILKAIQERKPMHIEGFTYIGFKTDNKGDLGSEYTDTSTVEDYIAKMTMLLQGYLIFPTLADKGTWMVMNGVPIPGMKFIDYTDEDTDEVTTTVLNAPSVRIINGKPYLIPNDTVLDQMIEYAKCELLGIQQCMEDLGYDKIPGYIKLGRPKLTEEQKIANYHTDNGDVEPNGTRFLSLTKVVTYDYDEEDKKWKLTTHNLNDPKEDSVTLLKRAQDVFFAKRDGESTEQMIARLRESMALTLAILTLHEVNSAVDLGIVQKISYSAKFGLNEIKVSSEDKNLMNLDTKDLNILQIKALLLHIMRTTKTSAGILWKDVIDPSKRQFYSKMAKSLAIASILQDATNRHIICSQEVQRCFSGHPALFKVKYGKNGVKDSAYDIQKRIGGMVSTGEDNILNIPGIKSEYVCAECNDYEVGSNANISGRLSKMFSESQARYIFAIKSNEWEDAYNMSIDALKEKYPDYVDVIDDALTEGKKYAQSFTKGINVADGASYITADMCRDMLRMRGAYNNKVRTAFKILMSSTKYDWVKSAEAYKTIYDALNIVPTKYTAYGFRPHTLNGSQVSDVAVAYYNKFALFPIFPCMATGKMESIYDKMVKEQVDMLLMTSAIKVGSQGAVSFNGETISDPFNKYTQSYAYLRRQLNTDPEEKDESAIGTQMIKIGLSNLDEKRTYVDIDGNIVDGDQILTEFMGSINALADIGEQELKDMFLEKVTKVTKDGHRTFERIDYEKLSNYLKEQLTTRNANKTLVQSIQVITDPVTGNKRLAIPLAATTDAAWIESIFISTMNKKIVDITTPGKSFIQRSVFAIEGESLLASTINRGNSLQMINEEGSMDCVISIDYFNDILPEGLSFDLAKQWLIDQGIISGYVINDYDMSQEWHDAEAIMIGYRIPTQAQSSIHALRVVDVLPATKTTIVLPEEFTKITGSDFDIDHLYLASFNFRKDENKHLTRLYEAGTKQYYQNRILSLLMTLLKDTENSLNSLYKPIDNDTELVTNVSDYIPESGSTKGDPYNFGTLHELVIRKNDYITGKKGIGPFALNSTSHMLCRQFGVRFRPSKLVSSTRLSNLDTRLDKDNKSVSSWLSGFINAHVDIVKDPYISRLNVNPFTYNMLNLMIRCGWGDTSLWFLANPIIRAMADANDLANSQYMKRPNRNKSGKTQREQLIYNAVTKYLNEEDISDEVIGQLLGSPKRSLYRIDIINWLDIHQDKLKEAAITGNMDHETAVNVYYAWKILEKYSTALGNLVQHTKVDTRKYGKNFIAVSRYYTEYKEIFRPLDSTESLWDIESLDKLERGSWLLNKTDLVAKLPLLIFGDQTFNGNLKFINAVNKLAKHLEYDGRKLYQDDVVALSRHLLTAIKSKYFVKYAKDVLKMSDKDIADLFVGNRSLNRRLVSLKDVIANRPKFKRLASNPFLNQIYSMLEDKPVFTNGRELSDRPGFVTVLDNVDDSKLNSDLLSEGWLDLMNDEEPSIRDIARRFVIYAFFSSGEFKGWNKLLKYVPYEWISGQVDPEYTPYSKFIEDLLLNISEDYSDLYDDIVANNFMDYRFAKQMDEVNEDNTLNFLNHDRGVRIGKGVSFDLKEQLPNYVSIRKRGMRSGHQDSYDLFKLIYTVKVGKEYFPVYAKIKKRGYHTRGNDIYEYRWNFNYAENERAGSDTFDYDGALKRVSEFVKSGELIGFSLDMILRINKLYIREQDKGPVAPKVKTVEPGAHIATRGYKKGDPLKHPNFNYVFTENAQAYMASTGKLFGDIGVSTSKDFVKINVSDVNGTNQAGIRTDEKGNITPNAYGIVVKKYQQDKTGKFVSQAGVFLDTDEDFSLFKSINEDMFNRLQNSSNNIIIFPQQMALGKAALPKRFAEWLQGQLADRFNIISEIEKNERSDYEGYGLKIKEVGEKYDWKYEEDSGYSGVLEELELPKKIRMNGRFTYRPVYNFGRIYLTDSEKQYISEKIKATINGIEYSSEEIYNIAEFYDSGKFNINSFGKEPIDDKGKIPIPKEYESLIATLFDDCSFISEKDFDESGEKISKRAVEYILSLLDNDMYSFIENLAIFADDLNFTKEEMFRRDFKDILYDVMDFYLEEGLIDEKDNVEYSYTDSRQQDLFSDEDFDPSFREHCKN